MRQKVDYKCRQGWKPFTTYINVRNYINKKNILNQYDVGSTGPVETHTMYGLNASGEGAGDEVGRFQVTWYVEFSDPFLAAPAP